MTRSRAFIDREVFEALLSEVGTVDGHAYEDVQTAYGDMSRLVVAWLASMTTTEIRTRYNELTWEGSIGARAMREAARLWLTKYHPDRLNALDQRAANAGHP